MPQPKKTVKIITVRLTEKAWKKLEGKGNISKLVNQAVEEWNEQQTPTDINHLNINQKDGVIQTYLRKREERLELMRERIEEARAKADIKVETARKIAEINKQTENEKRFAKRYIRSGKPKVDWGDSEGFDGFKLGDR